MILIVIHHISKHGGFFENSTGFTRVVLEISNALFLPSVNVFVYVSTYLIVKKGKVGFRGYFRIYFQVLFYSLLTFLLTWLLTKNPISFSTVIKNFFPIIFPVFWFAGAYLLMYILSPILLKIINLLKQKQYAIVVLVTISLVMILSAFPQAQAVLFGNGFNTFWFCVLFLISGYQAKFGINLKKWQFVLIYVASSCLAYLLILKNQMNVNYSHIIVLIQAVSLFSLLYDINCKNKVVVWMIKHLSLCTFGIYLLHDGVYMQQVLYDRVLQTQNYYGAAALGYFILFLLLIAVSGVVVDFMRRVLFKMVLWIIATFKRRRSSGNGEPSVGGKQINS